MDDQVKIRGYRVEPREVEAVLAEADGVVECAVVADGLTDETRLAAFVVAGAEGVSSAGLRAHVSGRLPAYMVPQVFEALPALPRLPNGKVDRSQLPAPAWGRGAETAHVPARTELETVLTEVWRDVLGIEEVGVHDDFFALGGHSLLATRLVSRLRDRLRLEVPLFSVFEYPTVAGLADTIERGAASSADAFPGVRHRGRDPSGEYAV
jgi:acyl carrier protein